MEKKKNFKSFLQDLTGLAGYLVNSRYDCECSCDLLHKEVFKVANSMIGQIAFDKYTEGEDFSNEKGHIADQVAYNIAYKCE